MARLFSKSVEGRSHFEKIRHPDNANPDQQACRNLPAFPEMTCPQDGISRLRGEAMVSHPPSRMPAPRREAFADGHEIG
ncbi:hypothetical protein CFR73_11290 [Novacetimonas maltaceti]|nr:hypothetical protein CFR73_11290 [Novacetimonas maltaceti]